MCVGYVSVCVFVHVVGGGRVEGVGASQKTEIPKNWVWGAHHLNSRLLGDLWVQLPLWELYSKMVFIFGAFFPVLVFLFSPRPQFGHCRHCWKPIHRILVVSGPGSQWQNYSPLFIQKSHLINLNQFANVFICTENPLDKQEFCDIVHNRTAITKKSHSLKKVSWPADTQAIPDHFQPGQAASVCAWPDASAEGVLVYLFGWVRS